MYLSIDPGLSTGWAWWKSADGPLVACGSGKKVIWPAVSLTIEHLVIEMPKIYTARLMKGDPNNILTLAVMVGRYIERFGGQGFTTVFPNEWKGTQDKPIHHPKIFQALGPVEQDIVRLAGAGKGAGPLGDMLDAIGLGQYAIRMGYFK